MRVLMQRQRHAPTESEAFNAPLQDAIYILQAVSARLMIIVQLTAQVTNSNDAAQFETQACTRATLREMFILCEHQRPPSSGRV